MDTIFLKVLNMSTGACYVIAAVLLARLLLRRAPKRYSYILWAVVGFRLCCPFSFQAFFSLFSMKPLQSTLSVGSGTANPVFFPEVYGALEHVASSEINEMRYGVVNVTSPIGPEQTVTISTHTFMDVAVIVWIAGIILFLLYGMTSYLLVRRKMTTAVHMEGDVWLSDKVKSPFILGIFLPKIFIPFGLSEETLACVLTHERVHLQRKDHLVKIFAFLVLTIHWFNPLVWLSFRLLSKDMEMSCDEAVLQRLEEKNGNKKKGYSMSLLTFASDGRFYTPGPLAFGESAVKSRIKNILRWEKPKWWITAAAMVLCLTVMAACAANPMAMDIPAVTGEEDSASSGQITPADSAQETSLGAEAEIKALLAVQKLLNQWGSGNWAILLGNLRDGTTWIEKSTVQLVESQGSHHGYYTVYNLQFDEGLTAGSAGIAIRVIDGEERLNAVLEQPLEEDVSRGVRGARMEITLDAEIQSPQHAEVRECILRVERSREAAAEPGIAVEGSYLDFKIPEELVEAVALSLYRNVPEYVTAEQS